MANEVNYGRIAIIPKGDFAGDVQYDVGDVVSYEGSSYLAKSKPPVGTLPTDENYWQISAYGSKYIYINLTIDEYNKRLAKYKADPNYIDPDTETLFSETLYNIIDDYETLARTAEGINYTDTYMLGATNVQSAIDTHISDNTKHITTKERDLWNDVLILGSRNESKIVELEGTVGFTDISTVGDGTVTGAISALNEDLTANISHNIPRLVPKDITSYYNDGTLWQRLNGTDGFGLFEDIFVGDYIKMSRPISAYNQDQTYQLTGSQYVTIAGIDTLWGNGDTITMAYHHLVMVPGMGFGGTQHFGMSRMNPTHTTVGGYVGSEMHKTTIGDIATSGSTETTATINQQLYAEFGSHLKTTRELLSNAINSTGYNRFGSNTGCSNGWVWTDCQAVLMSEIEVYGSIVWSSSGYDTGTAKVQLPLFANNKCAINNRSAYYFFKDVASASSFCYCYGCGYANCLGAGYANCYVRSRFVIAA